jgi:hypothetical protein
MAQPLQFREAGGPMNQSTANAVRVGHFDQPPALVRPALASVPLPHRDRMEVLQGMLRRLEDVTPAGQQYLMAKVVPLLRREAIDQAGRFQRSELTTIEQSLDRLEHEASRLAPNVGVFSQRAQILADVFALA